MKHLMHNLARHAPAGRSIPWAAVWGRAGTSSVLPWPKFCVRYFDSGTAALAVAIRAALDRLVTSGGRRTVVLPAYGCPDLLAATLWAGGEPEFVDFAVDSVAPDASALRRRLQQMDAVVVAVDSFGIDSLREKFESLPSDQADLLVHDLAQSYAPYEADWMPFAASSIVSFGKAKPLSMTLGGALISRFATLRQSTEMSPGIASPSIAAIALRAFAYNVSLHPSVFGVLCQIPILKIGRTQFTPINAVREYEEAFSRRVAAAIYSDAIGKEDHIASVREMMALVVGSGCELPVGVTGVPTARLWRLPVICPSQKAAAKFAIEFASLGVSRLYERLLPEFAGVASADCAKRWPIASDMAGKLITLPTHGRLRDASKTRLRIGLLAMSEAGSTQVRS